MSQPCDRKARVPLPGKLDRKLNEFWSENPWELVDGGHNLSMYERNRVWMNHHGKDFLDFSYLTGMDSDGDGRCAVAADFRNNGQLDLIVRQVGGGPLFLFENNHPKRHYLKVSLRGIRSSRAGIGARITAEVGGLKMPREMYPLNSFLSQAPNIAHFGLGDAVRVDRLTIRWPSGEEQVLTNVLADQHIIVSEGKERNAAAETIVPGNPIAP